MTPHLQVQQGRVTLDRLPAAGQEVLLSLYCPSSFRLGVNSSSSSSLCVCELLQAIRVPGSFLSQLHSISSSLSSTPRVIVVNCPSGDTLTRSMSPARWYNFVVSLHLVAPCCRFLPLWLISLQMLQLLILHFEQFLSTAAHIVQKSSRFFFCFPRYTGKALNIL